MKLPLITAAAVATIALAGCDNTLTETQKTLRSQGRPFLIAEADGLRAYQWSIPRGRDTKVLFFISGQATQNCVESDCTTVDASMVGQPVITEEAFVAMSRLTPEERRALGLTR